MRSAALVFASLQYVAVASAASVPRGVGPEFAKFYESASTFKCVSNPTIEIPFARVNDDYCDCPDGSDEPGTAACAHLSPLSPHTLVDTPVNGPSASAALPGFFCQNKGHLPSYVPFANVNDGVCDYDLCCDGSEEWENIGGVKCKDRCDEIGKEWRKKDAARAKSASNAAKKRAELVKEAARLKQTVREQVELVNTQIEAGQVKLTQLERELEEIRRNEAGKVVKAGKTSGKLGILIAMAQRRTQELRSALLVELAQKSINKARLEKLEAIMTTFKEEYNPNFNDEGVKRAVRAWEEYVASGSADIPSAHPRDIESIVKDDKENGVDWDSYEASEETVQPDETDALYVLSNYLPPSLRSWLDDKIRELKAMLVANGILADTGSASGDNNESKKVTEARQRVEVAQKDLENHRKSLQESQDDLAADFGPDDIFRALKGTCIESDSGEYTYEHCFLERTTQKSKKGGGHTDMGRYVRMERITVDEDVGSDGKGLGKGERIALKYENGQHCWNGPLRSTTAVLACSEQNEIWKIVEEEKCVYRMEVGTPAVCGTEAGANPAAAAAGGHDEL